MRSAHRAEQAVWPLGLHGCLPTCSMSSSLAPLSRRALMTCTRYGSPRGGTTHWQPRKQAAGLWLFTAARAVPSADCPSSIVSVRVRPLHAGPCRPARAAAHLCKDAAQGLARGIASPVELGGQVGEDDGDGAHAVVQVVVLRKGRGGGGARRRRRRGCKVGRSTAAATSCPGRDGGCVCVRQACSTPAAPRMFLCLMPSGPALRTRSATSLNMVSRISRPGGGEVGSWVGGAQARVDEGWAPTVGVWAARQEGRRAANTSRIAAALRAAAAWVAAGRWAARAAHPAGCARL